MTGVRGIPEVQPRRVTWRSTRRLEFPQVGAANDARSLTRLALGYLEASAVRGFSSETVRTDKGRLRLFLLWCEARRLKRPSELTVGLMERYQRYLYQRRKKDGSGHSVRTQVQQLCTVKSFFRWLVRKHLVLSNPAADIELPKPPDQLPMNVLSAHEAEQVLSQPDVATPLGLRDRAIMELLYSTGLRRAELSRLNVADIDFGRGVVMVHAGKGNKDRVVPIGERALKWLQRYLEDVRPHYLFGEAQPALWVNYVGKRVAESYLGQIVRNYLESSDVGKAGSCHMFRHTAATLMLENGADVRFIQAMLGHASLESTQIYTRVSIAKLKEVHDATHPAQRKRKRTTAAPSSEAAASNEAATPADDGDHDKSSKPDPA